MMGINKYLSFFAILLFSCFSCRSHVSQSDVYVEDLYISNILKASEFSLPLSMVVRNTNGDSIAIKEIVKDSERIVLRISNSFCSSCIDEELDRIAELCTDSSVVIIASYQNPRLMKVYERKKLIQNPIYFIEQSMANVFLSENDKYGSPYYFIINKKGECFSVFFPSLDCTSISERYINYSMQYLSAKLYKESLFSDKALYIDSVRMGDTVNISLNYTNIYNVPLTITHVDNSCDCAIAEFSTKELKPHENGSVLIKYIPDCKGEKKLQFKIWHNQSSSPEVVTLYSNAT